jgi:hypothetical protein
LNRGALTGTSSIVFEMLFNKEKNN